MLSLSQSIAAAVACGSGTVTKRSKDLTEYPVPHRKAARNGDEIMMGIVASI
jgi:hypothetical protein